MERDIIFGKIEEGTYMHCMHCERIYRYGDHRKVKLNGKEFLEMCPYNGCDGDAVLDATEWSEVRNHHPEYPETPIKDIIYPLN